MCSQGLLPTGLLMYRLLVHMGLCATSRVAHKGWSTSARRIKTRRGYGGGVVN